MNDVKHIYELKELRDMIAHEAVNLILEGEPQIDFNQKIELCTQYIRKIENWWIINFELPIDMESDPTKSPNEESVLSGNEILAKYVVNLADDIKKAIK